MAKQSNPVNTGNKTAKEVKRNERGQIVKGSASLNPDGRPNGRLNFATEMELGIEKLAKENNMTPAELKIRLYAKGFKLASDGEYPFYKDYMDRTHGKPDVLEDDGKDSQRSVVAVQVIINGGNNAQNRTDGEAVAGA